MRSYIFLSFCVLVAGPANAGSGNVLEALQKALSPARQAEVEAAVKSKMSAPGRQAFDDAQVAKDKIYKATGPDNSIGILQVEPDATVRRGKVTQTLAQSNGRILQFQYDLPDTKVYAQKIFSGPLTYTEEPGVAGRLRAMNKYDELKDPTAVNSMGIHRVIETPAGQVNEVTSYTAREISSRYTMSPLRVQETQQVIHPNHFIISKRIDVDGQESIKVNVEYYGLRSGKKEFDAVLPVQYSFGKILKWEFNEDASRLTVWTSQGYKTEYAVVQDGSSLKLRFMGYDRFDPGSYAAQVKSIPAPAALTKPKIETDSALAGTQ